MSKASDKITADIMRYISAMREAGKTPTVVHITQQQFSDLKNGLSKGGDDEWKPEIKGVPLEVVKT